MNLLRMVKPIKDLLVADRRAYRPIRRGPAKGQRMWLNPSEDLWIQLGFLETEIQETVEALIEPGDTCYDIGAAFGYYTLACKRLSRGGPVVAIDGDPGRLQVLEETLAVNEMAGDRTEIIDAFVGNDHGRQGMVSLDGLVFEDGHPAPDVIKMDIEGAEASALEGAARVLEEHRPKLIIEIHDAEQDRRCRSLLQAAGYQLAVIDQEASWLRDDPDPERKWFAAVPVERSEHPGPYVASSSRSGEYCVRNLSSSRSLAPRQ